MREESKLLAAVVKATGKLHAQAAELDRVDRQIREREQRENAVSPESDIGEIEPDEETTPLE